MKLLVVEPNCTWQMAIPVCFNTANTADHVKEAFGNKLLKTFLSVRNTTYIVVINDQSACVWNTVVDRSTDSGCCQVNILYAECFNMQVVDRRI